MLKGYIEGYYGRLFSQQERESLLDHMGQLKMDFYIYGPKEDPFHRLTWEKLYPKKEKEVLSKFVKHSKKKGIKPIFALSPGLKLIQSVQFKKQITAKLNQAKKIGFRDFAIFFDDIDHKRDKSLANQHLDVIEIVSSLNLSNNPLYICPTVYCKSFAKGKLRDNEYLTTLAKEIDPSVRILWTGDEVVSKSIGLKGIRELKRLFTNPIVIWDNFYANDYCPSKFYLGPYSGRNLLDKEVVGIGINPTGMVHTDSMCLDRFVLNKAEDSLIRDFEIPKEFKLLMPYFNDPFKNLPELNLKKIDKLLETQYKLCIEWKSSLQLEWSPFLWRFYLDLILLRKLIQKDSDFNLEEWIKRRYSDPLKQTLLRD